MKKFIAVLAVVLLLCGIAFVFIWPVLRMEFASSAHYNEQDKREYKYYTPELLKKMPRISKDYEFHYTNISGPQAFVFGIHFNGTTETSRIRKYLISEGYIPQKECQVQAECWRSPRNNDVVSLYKLVEFNEAGVEIYRRPNKE